MLAAAEFVFVDGGERLSEPLDDDEVASLAARRRSLSTRWLVGRRLSLSPRGRLVLPLAAEEFVNRGIVTVEHVTGG